MGLKFRSLFCRLGQAGRQAGRRINNILYRISQNEGIKVERGEEGRRRIVEEYMGNCAKRDSAPPAPLAPLDPLSFCVVVMKTRDM